MADDTLAKPTLRQRGNSTGGKGNSTGGSCPLWRRSCPSEYQ